jgi:hypothetical protein
MYTIHISELSTLAYFGWHIKCPAGFTIARNITAYKTRNNAKRWAKYWAEKFSFQSFIFKEK